MAKSKKQAAKKEAAVKKDTNLVSVKIVKMPSVAGFNLCWHLGQVAKVTEPLAKELVESKIAVLVDE